LKERGERCLNIDTLSPGKTKRLFLSFAPIKMRGVGKRQRVNNFKIFKIGGKINGIENSKNGIS